MIDHPVDEILRVAFLEGVVHTRGAWERAVARRSGHVTVAPDTAALLEQRLVHAMAGSIRAELLTVGTFLQHTRTQAAGDAEVVAPELGLTRNIYRLLEHDRISPLRIRPEVWRRIRLQWNIPCEVLEGMLRRTHQLVFFRPSYRATLARYRPAGGTTRRSSAMQKAATELYTRARLELPPEAEKRLQELIRAVGE
jgi:hypothetical protein